MPAPRVRAAAVALVLVSSLAATPPGRAQTSLVDYLLAELFSTADKTPYELTADFTGTLTVTAKGSSLVAYAEGSFVERRGNDGIRRRKVTIRKLALPLLLRPFASSLSRAIEEKIETQAENPDTFYAHDIFFIAEQPEHRYVLGGVHRDIVNEAIDRYGKPQDKLDVTTRRKIAQWLYSAPTMRDFLVRPGPPYALRAIIGADGLLYELVVSYDWGEVSTRIGYVVVRGQPVWAQVTADTVSTLSGLGRVTGQLALNFTNHCVNCNRP